MTASDYVILGGGSAGCVVASRLSEDPNSTVTLLEAGPWDSSPWIHLPVGFARLYVTKKFDWEYHTEPEPELDGRRVYWPRGKVMGGSGSVNGLVWLRGSPRDYDRWAQAGARGWSYEDCLPAFRRMETVADNDDPLRGHDGPMRVAEVRDPTPGCRAFVEACQALGFPRNPDFNGAWYEGVAPNQLNVHKGRRWSPAVAYIHPARKRPNLRIETECLGLSLIFDGRRCTGVRIRRKDGTVQEFLARREVVLCCGAIESPKMLMLSGIGPAAHLAEHGIAVRHDAPDVGQNLQDHFQARISFRTRPADTLNETMASLLGQARMAMKWALTRRGHMTVGASEASLFARVLPGAEEPDVQYQFINFTMDTRPGTVAAELHKHPGFAFNFCQARPESRGAVTLRSADPAEKPAMVANYLTHPTDARIMLEAARLGRRIAATSPFADLVEEEINPGRGAQTDAELMHFIRQTGGTVYHPCGTNRMGSDARSVVDPELRVRGVEGLRVADASVFPTMPSTNIQPACIMTGERCAELIRAA